MRVPSEIRPAVASLHRVRPLIYWLDFLGAAAAGWSFFFLGLWAPGWLAVPAALSAIGLLRATYFIHEIAH